MQFTTTGIPADAAVTGAGVRAVQRSGDTVRVEAEVVTDGGVVRKAIRSANASFVAEKQKLLSCLVSLPQNKNYFPSSKLSNFRANWPSSRICCTERQSQMQC